MSSAKGMFSSKKWQEREFVQNVHGDTVGMVKEAILPVITCEHPQRHYQLPPLVYHCQNTVGSVVTYRTV